MIKSMTGFGSHQVETDDYFAVVEVKSLNSKFLDAMIRLPRIYSEKEIDIRNMASDILKRGKLSISLEVEFKRIQTPNVKFNKDLFREYYKKLQELGEGIDVTDAEYFKMAFQLPEVTTPSESRDEETELWDDLSQIVRMGLLDCDQFRTIEGNNLIPKIRQAIDVIDGHRLQILGMDSSRIESVRNRINDAMSEIVNDNQFDKNRFEQELIYFIEKLDITEELDRLESHLGYFRDVLEEEDSSGKKLGFIAQEIGREINTVGSKASNADVQKIVVQMKDELEKIKEQILNVV